MRPAVAKFRTYLKHDPSVSYASILFKYFNYPSLIARYIIDRVTNHRQTLNERGQIRD